MSRVKLGIYELVCGYACVVHAKAGKSTVCTYVGRLETVVLAFTLCVTG